MSLLYYIACRPSFANIVHKHIALQFVHSSIVRVWHGRWNASYHIDRTKAIFIYDIHTHTHSYTQIFSMHLVGQVYILNLQPSPCVGLYGEHQLTCEYPVFKELSKRRIIKAEEKRRIAKSEQYIEPFSYGVNFSRRTRDSSTQQMSNAEWQIQRNQFSWWLCGIQLIFDHRFLYA